ncbi:glycosyltransferase [Actinomycetota bacterium]|nr:glycosyltransferase [Actinomycetota bacterium]
MGVFSNTDVSVVVCTKNSISGIEDCLKSLRESLVGEIIVVDADSTDGSKQIAESLADEVIEDLGIGLGNARNMGIAVSSHPLVLNMGSDNLLPPNQLQRMIGFLVAGNFSGVSAQTRVQGSSYNSRGLNAWREGRFPTGQRAVIGTPTLFLGDVLRQNPYDSSRMFSDDSELCERWKREFGAIFAISDAYVEEIGKTTWREIRIRARMYGVSDHETYRAGNKSWDLGRKIHSLLHPLNADFLTPVRALPVRDAVVFTPFLAEFTFLRYGGWIRAAFKRDPDNNTEPSSPDSDNFSQ